MSSAGIRRLWRLVGAPLLPAPTFSPALPRS